jgi:hypothetical protein
VELLWDEAALEVVCVARFPCQCLARDSSEVMKDRAEVRLQLRETRTAATTHESLAAVRDRLGLRFC